MKKRYVFGIVMQMVFLFNILVKADTYIVSNTDPSGTGSLAQAILDANNHNGADTIVFHIPEGVGGHEADPGIWRIQPTNLLLHLSDDSTLIDGTSQADFIEGDPNADGPEIVLDGLNSTYDYGFYVSGSHCTVTCLCIHRFEGDQIHIVGDSNSVKGCYIGPDPTGVSRVGSKGRGFMITCSSYNVIGGAGEEERNVISGNGKTGISLMTDALHNHILGNYVGINSTGTDTLGNSLGIGLSYHSAHNVIGPGNIISGNNQSGIYMGDTDTDSNSVIGNYIGTDPSGKEDWGNLVDGVQILIRASHNVIGGSLPEERNIISGNEHFGIKIDGGGTNSNSVLGNYIGTDISGTEALPNGIYGIWIAYGANYNQVGGTTEGEGNLISGNLYWGIYILGETTENNQIIGNIIGADISGTTALANGSGGISISAHDNMVGPENIVAFNGGTGVEIFWEGSVNNTLTRNSIFGNQGLGIDNADGGNLEIDPPVITSIGSVSGTAIPNSKIEIFSGPDGEGKTFEDSVFTNGSGNFTWSGTPAGPYVTATATDGDGNTSEFSDSVFVTVNVEKKCKLPLSFFLSQNYPNPFNPETRIQYHIKEPCLVQLKVYNLVGKEVMILVDGHHKVGKHEVVFNGSQLPSGLYFYRIQMDGYEAVRKMLLLE